MVDFKAKKEQSNINVNNYFINFKVYSYAKQSKAVPPLNSILGQYNVPLMEFCNRFNSLTTDYAEGLQIYAIVSKKIKSKEFELKIKKLNLKVMFEVFLSNYLDSDDPDLIESLEIVPIEIIYDIIKLYAMLHNLPVSSSAKLVLSYLSTNEFIKKIQIN